MATRVKMKPDQLDDSWMKKGKCRTSGVNPEMFYAPDEDDPETGKKRQERSILWKVKPICGSCPVSGNCLDWAMTLNEQGIWGGTTTEERQVLKRFRERARCLRCRSRLILAAGDDAQACGLCGLSWQIPERE